MYLVVFKFEVLQWMGMGGVPEPSTSSPKALTLDLIGPEIPNPGLRDFWGFGVSNSVSH